MNTRTAWILASSLVFGFLNSAIGAGKYFEVTYPSPDAKPENMPALYRIWIPDKVTPLRGVIVHVHGSTIVAGKAGANLAYDLHWQALARKWDCALLGPSCPNVTENWHRFSVPGGGNREVFLKALRELSEKSNHPELEKVPWCLWGHSGGAIWAGLMQAHDPDRIVAIWLRSGSGWGFAEEGWIPNWRLEPTDAIRGVPVMLNPGKGEEDHKGFAKIYTDSWGMLKSFRAKDATVGVAVDPRTDHNCGDSRLLAIPFFDTCLSMRLPDKGSKDQKLKPIDMKLAWLAEPYSDTAVSVTDFKGDHRQAVWLPNESFAKKWMEYVKTGFVTDSTPPPAPTNVKMIRKPDKSVELTWNAEIDFESGLRTFVIMRNNERIGRVEPQNSDGGGKPLFQGVSYHDTPMKPDAEMLYLDKAPPDGKQSYQVISVNSQGLKSKPVTPGRK